MTAHVRGKGGLEVRVGKSSGDVVSGGREQEDMWEDSASLTAPLLPLLMESSKFDLSLRVLPALHSTTPLLFPLSFTSGLSLSLIIFAISLPPYSSLIK